MKIIIPMAGRSQRFKDAGISVPKMLILIKGKPMFLWAIKNLPKDYDDYIFICLKRHIDEFGLDEKLNEYTSGQSTIISINEPTEGQACTALHAREFISDEALLIHNVDTFFDCDLSFIRNRNIDGAIPYFDSKDPSLSFLRIKQDNIVSEVLEKKSISTHAAIGLYYFVCGNDFVRAANNMIRKNVRILGEFYIGPVYNELIRNSAKIIGVPAKAFWDLGTPEKVDFFERNYEDG